VVKNFPENAFLKLRNRVLKVAKVADDFIIDANHAMETGLKKSICRQIRRRRTEFA
jgi:hypothetical protein